MADRKRSSKRQQAHHKQNRKKSQHDKRERLNRSRVDREKTTKAEIPLKGPLGAAVKVLQSVMDRRISFRFSIIVAGMLLARGRRTASAWFIAAGVKDDWDRFYDCLISIGRTSAKVATAVLGLIVKKLGVEQSDRIVLALDDSPTSRYGKHVEGAGVHHNPTPGPADGEWLYGHNWVSLVWLGTHPIWGVIALPMLSLLYVRQINIPRLKEKYAWKFRTKHELGVELLTWFVKAIGVLGVKKKIWLVADGAYAARPFVKPLLKLGVTVASRLRKDACLYDLPGEPKSRQRGRPRIYGKNKISLAKRAAHRKGWQSISFTCRGVKVTRQYKTFLTTSRLTGGVIRVVIVRFDDGGWAPYFCTDELSEVCDILEAVSARWAIEEHFHDVKEIWGAGQQQVRNIWSNIGCWNLNGWLYTLVELCSWNIEKAKLTDRTNRPWDNPDRRPSHTDRKRSFSKEMMRQSFHTTLKIDRHNHKINSLFQFLIALAA